MDDITKSKYYGQVADEFLKEYGDEGVEEFIGRFGHLPPKNVKKQVSLYQKGNRVLVLIEDHDKGGFFQVMLNKGQLIGVTSIITNADETISLNRDKKFDAEQFEGIESITKN